MGIFNIYPVYNGHRLLRLIGCRLLLASLLMLAYSISYSQPFRTWDDEQMRTVGLVKAAGEMLAFSDRVLRVKNELAIKNVLTKVDMRRVELYDELIRRFGEAHDAMIQFLIVLRLSLDGNLDKGFAGHLVGEFCRHRPVAMYLSRTLAASDQFSFERKLLASWFKEIGLTGSDGAEIDAHLETSFRIRLWYRDTCRRADDIKNWER